MPNMDTTSLTIVNNIHVTVPASLQSMTTYILQEQNDWFEDEIKFIRHFVKPGMRVVDIGANYGLYTLTIADMLGDSGKIWAFEPTEATSVCLKESISCNKFNNINLIQSGLSDRLGEAKLFTSPNSELNTLSKDVSFGGQYETVSLLTLDYCNHEYKWESIDFIKLDVVEQYGIKGLATVKTLSSLSPLIMFELKHRENVNLPLINRFKTMGYDSYRLIPGLNILIPFDHNEPFDRYLLNLFCCKEDKARQLEEEGVIVRSWELKSATVNAPAKQYIEKLAHGALLRNMSNISQCSGHGDYLSILNSYIMSLSEAEGSSDRVGYLMNSLSSLRQLIAKGEQRVERLVTFARIAFDAGECALGLKILSDLINKYSANINYELSELFLPASQRYDSVYPDKGIRSWLFSSILEQCIEKHAYSTYFSRSATLPLFEQLYNLGYMDENMQRRFRLVKSCFS